ncbi:LIM domain protein [Ancylostoma caninum]|uniref:LIM domain protein n=1 Tax=Ancylostoma caninum TaxID=29170 RepID=A0A368H515_ANCCA|nr:LIM domain protein [Ancylostoma caninum]
MSSMSTPVRSLNLKENRPETNGAPSTETTRSPPSCHRCRQLFQEGELYVALEGTSWHQGCFRCSQCLLPIALDDDYFKLDGRFYCRHDFEVLYAPICAKCNSFVLGKVMRSANCSFHPGCFKCESCAGNLDYGVWCVDGRMVCHNCKEMLPKTTHFICKKCHRPIEHDDLLRSDNDFFHSYHFSCAGCKTALTGGARQLAKEWFCPRCFDLRCEPCAGCHRPIDKQNERSTLALGKSFHIEHFRCAMCDVAFMGAKHFEHSGKAYCKDDFMTLWAEFCHRCNQLLSDTSVNVLSKKWCVQCYRCLACDKALRHSDEVFNLDMRPMCKKCYRRKDFRRYLKEGSHS